MLFTRKYQIQDRCLICGMPVLNYVRIYDETLSLCQEHHKLLESKINQTIDETLKPKPVEKVKNEVKNVRKRNNKS